MRLGSADEKIYMEKDYKNELLKYINDSTLGNDQKDLWDIFTKISLPDEDEAVYEAVTQDNESLMLLTDHLRDKIWDMKENNKEAWERICKDQAIQAKGQ